MILLFIFAVLAFGGHRDAYAQANYFQGKTVRVVIATTTGGGYDLWARLASRHLGKHIPGNPTIIAQNMPGAGGVVGANYLYGIAKPDGLTIGAFNPALYFDQLVGRSEVKFDWAKFTWIGTPEQNDILHFIRTDAPFKTIDDLRNAKDPAKCGSTGTGTTGHYIPRLLEDTLGIKTNIVSGYQGGTEIDLAIERNEVVCWSPLVATYFGREPYKRWQKSGFTRVVLQTGTKRDARIKDVPTLNELMQQYKTAESGRRLAKVILTAATLGRPIAAPPGVSADRVKVLRDAYAKTMTDPELLAETAKLGWDVQPLTGQELEVLAKEVIAQPKDVIERMKWVLGRE
ncbi:MAG TPA: tripartite tricarboxylate transporter substrate-binding protein [Candidatus Binatia bacterium]|jgi:tripartite-type tricarboxylate transporter receptor subunit TctC|nr:tripartite tricarboxylate transporter substrate-binding protein [Candidatus Binatia bacterium]